MSAWVHVSAIARIDYIQILNDDNEVDFDKVFGRECLWEDDSSVWERARTHEEEFLPMGSEGSLQKSVWVNPDDHCAARYTVSIFGDLRDVESGKWIIDWFKEKLRKMRVRQASITINSEYYGISTWTYGGDD